MNPLNQMFSGMMNPMRGSTPNGMPGMGNPQQMMQMFMNMMQGGGNGGPEIQNILANVSVDDYNRYLLQALTKFDDIYGKKEGTLTHILFNSGLTIEQLQDAIVSYKSK